MGDIAKLSLTIIVTQKYRNARHNMLATVFLDIVNSLLTTK